MLCVYLKVCKQRRNFVNRMANKLHPFSLKCQKRPREGMLHVMCQQPKQVRHWKNVGAHVDHKCAIGNVRFGLIGIYMFQWQRNIRRK